MNKAAIVFSVVTMALSGHAALAQTQGRPIADARTAPADRASTTAATKVTPPAGYLIGADDTLTIQFWSPIDFAKEKDPSGDVIVRPDGKISLPLVNDVVAAGLTPDQLRERIVQAFTPYVRDPNITVVVKQINSRKAFITGNVVKPGAYSLSGSETVLHLISLAGGLTEFADEKDIKILRTENGSPVTYRFNYKDVIRGRNVGQNIQLMPGDTVIVP